MLRFTWHRIVKWKQGTYQNAGAAVGIADKNFTRSENREHNQSKSKIGPYKHNQLTTTTGALAVWSKTYIVGTQRRFTLAWSNSGGGSAAAAEAFDLASWVGRRAGLRANN
eukprot:scaffold26931_cov52-Cyclotella_meneghiniana.AAC.4